MNDTTIRPGPFAKAKVPGPVETGERDPRFDNEPPLEDRVLMGFDEDLAAPGEMGVKSVLARIDELVASAGRAPEACNSEQLAGAMGDLCKQARDVEKRINDIREKHNRPLLNARERLKAKADATYAPLAKAVADIRSRVDTWIKSETERVAAERRAAQAEADRLEAEARRNESLPGEIVVDIKPKKVEEPVARGGLGARVGARKSYKATVVNMRQLPDRILKHPQVVEAAQKIANAEVRSGVREIKGCEINEEIGSMIR